MVRVERSGHPDAGARQLEVAVHLAILNVLNQRGDGRRDGYLIDLFTA